MSTPTSTILYKFRSSKKSFEALPLPGTSARLLDIKRAIVKAKKLDQQRRNGPMLDFELVLSNAMTHQVYEDESMLLPRGSRVLVARLPSAGKGMGLLARMARADAGQSVGVVKSAPSGFYTVESVKEEQEFVDAASIVKQEHADDDGDAEAKELELLQDAMDSTAQPNAFAARGPTMVRGNIAGSGGPMKGPPGGGFGAGPPPFKHARPNADPELAKLEQHADPPPKKRACGIPRTFLEPEISSALDTTAAGGGGGGGAPILIPHTQGFEKILKRGGGQSSSSANSDFSYALELTNTTLPDHFTCGICNKIVRNAIFIPWDELGRTACEVCMRDGLTKSGFVCPLTGQEGVSPDDVFPNVGLRKAVDAFMIKVRADMDEVLRVLADQEELEKREAEQKEKEVKEELLDEVDVNGMSAGANGSNQGPLDDFGEDDFGGDVFAVEEEEELETEPVVKQEETQKPKIKEEPSKESEVAAIKQENLSNDLDTQADNTIKTNESTTIPNQIGSKPSSSSSTSFVKKEDQERDERLKSSFPNNEHSKQDGESAVGGKSTVSTTSSSSSKSQTMTRKEMLANRAPPAGYSMGPAGGVSVHSRGPTPSTVQGGNQDGRGRGNNNGFRDGAGGRGGRGGRFYMDGGGGYRNGGGRGHNASNNWNKGGDFQRQDDSHSKGDDRNSKRPRNEGYEHSSGSGHGQDGRQNWNQGGRGGGRGGYHTHNNGGGRGYNNQRGWGGGSRGDYFQGGRGNGGFQQGRGRGDHFRGRGRGYGRGRGRY